MAAGRAKADVSKGMAKGMAVRVAVLSRRMSKAVFGSDRAGFRKQFDEASRSMINISCDDPICRAKSRL